MRRQKAIAAHLGMVKRATADAAEQLRAYRKARAERPGFYGNSLDGAADRTDAVDGPAYVIGIVGPAWQILWGFHKHAWAARFHWCIGEAKDARGERTDPALVIDLRLLPYHELIEKLTSADNYFDVIIDLIESSLRDGIDLRDFTVNKSAAA